LATLPGERFDGVDQLLAAIGRALRSRQRRIALVALAAAMLVAGAIVLALALRDGPPPDPIARVWSPARATTLREAMQRSQRPASFVTEQTNRAVARIEGWIADWRTASRAVAADRGASAAVTRHRRDCLDGRLRALDMALDAVIAAGDSVDSFGRTLAVVRDPRTCATSVPDSPSYKTRPGTWDRTLTLDITLDLLELDAKNAGPALDRIEPEIRALENPRLLARWLIVRGSSAHLNFDNAAAIRAFTEAAKVAPAADDELIEASVLTMLVVVTARTSETLAQAQTWAKAAEDAVARVRANPKLDGEQVMIVEMAIARALATLAASRGDAEAVVRHHERWVEAGKRGGDRSIHYGDALVALGLALRDTGQPAKAREQLEAAVAARRAVLGPVNPAVAEAMVYLAGLKYMQGELDAARSDYKAALAMFDATVGPKDSLRVEALIGIAELEYGAENHDSVLEYTGEGIDILRANEGEDSAGLARPLLLRANSQLALGDLKSARESIDRASAIDERTFGKDHPNMMFTLSLRAQIEIVAGEYDVARKAIARALAISPAPNPLFFVVVGELDLIERDYRAALRRFQEMERVVTAQWGADHLVTAFALAGQGRALVALGKPREALPVLDRAAAVAKKHDATGVAIGAMRVAMSRAVLAVKKDKQRAIEHARAGHEELILQKNFPGGRPALADATAWLDELTGGKR
jgi:serine/threonine-protein kinase